MHVLNRAECIHLRINNYLNEKDELNYHNTYPRIRHLHETQTKKTEAMEKRTDKKGREQTEVET